MIKAIVYNTNTGFTKKYAEMLSERIALPIFNCADAKKNLKRNDEVIFLSWVMANVLTKYSYVNAYFNIKAVGVVGIDKPADNESKKRFEGENNIVTDNVFYLYGGIDYKKLNKMYAKLFKMKLKIEKAKVENSGEATAEDYEKIDFLENGGSKVSNKQLDELAEWYYTKGGKE